MRLKPPQFSGLRKKAAVRSPDGDMNADEAEQVFKKKPTRRRALITSAALITVLMLGVVPVTYSYLMASSETVVNTFAGGAISLTLDEEKVDTDGNPLEDEPRVQENTYKVVPGRTLYKDPTVTVLAGSEVCYVYLYVENPLNEDYFTLDYSEDWIEVATTGTRTLYVYKTTVDASDGDVVLTPIFTTVTVSSELTAEQIEAMGEVQIKVQAYAIQAESVDPATATQMAADYFEAEFDFEWTDADTAVEIDGLITEEEDTAYTEASDEAADDTDTSAEDSGSTSSEGSSSDSSGSSGSDASTESADSSGDAAELDIIE